MKKKYDTWPCTMTGISNKWKRIWICHIEKPRGAENKAVLAFATCHIRCNSIWRSKRGTARAESDKVTSVLAIAAVSNALHFHHSIFLDKMNDHRP